MKKTHSKLPLLVAAALIAPYSASVLAQAVAATVPAASATDNAVNPLPADPWPRQINLSNATALMYQPQVSQWRDVRNRTNPGRQGQPHRGV